MRENRTYGLEGGESGSTGLPYPYHLLAKYISVHALNRNVYRVPDQFTPWLAVYPVPQWHRDHFVYRGLRPRNQPSGLPRRCSSSARISCALDSVIS
jgi:hypothetical protein